MQIIQKRKYFYFISFLFIIASVVTLSFWGLKLGIDFTGGTEMKIKFAERIPAQEEIFEKTTDLKLESFSVQPGEENLIILRYKNSDDETNEKVFEKIQEIDAEAIQSSVDFIGASVSKQLKKSAFWSLALAIIGIALYIAWAFRGVSYPISSWKYGLGAVIALSHDVIITLGIFSFLGKFYEIEVGVSFVAAILTILGYSVNDTIVVYDRTRENLSRSNKNEDFEDVVNRSLNETLARSINTSLTVILVLVALVVFGSEAIRYFSLAILIGVSFGTYSSIYVASAILVSIYKFQINKK